MRATERYRKLKEWLEKELCAGRMMKTPAPDGDITKILTAEPKVYIALQPMQPDEPGRILTDDPYSVAPSITIMPIEGFVRHTEEYRFDRYSGYTRSQQMGQSLKVTILFTVYEPGIRTQEWIDSMHDGVPDMALMKDGTQNGLFTLFDWMDDAMELILRERTVPDTDLMLEDDTMTYSLFSDQTYVADTRPLYYGFLRVEFKGYANDGSDKGRRTRAARLLEDE